MNETVPMGNNCMPSLTSPCRKTHQCQHPYFLYDTCTTCGAIKDGSFETVPFGYITEGWNISVEEIVRLRECNMKKLLRGKKLHLVLDLDHTLLHTKKLDKLQQGDREFVESIEGGNCNTDPIQCSEDIVLLKSKNMITKLRPYVRKFLEEASSMFEFSIYTMGSRQYAQTIASLLDPEGLYFGKSSLIGREDCTKENRKGLDVLLSDERMIVVVDDKEEVWEGHPRNLIKIAPYNFFGSTSSPMELKGDESEEHGELARVLRMLRKIHSSYFNNKRHRHCKDTAYEDRDVRMVVDEVKKEFSKSCEIDEIHGNLAEAKGAVCVDIQVC